MSGLALPFWGQIGGVDVRENAVHVPFDVGDIARGKDLGHLFDQPIGDLGIAQVKDPLVTTLAVEAFGNRRRPVGVLPIQAAVDVDHFRLDPDAEAESEIGDLFTQTFQPTGQLLGIGVPVAEGAGIVAAVAEPAVVHDEQLDPELFSRFRHGDQIAFADIEVGRFPRVEQDRTFLIRPFAAQDMLFHKAVHIAALTAEALLRKGHDRLRGVKDLAAFEQEAEARRIHALYNAGLEKGADLDGGVVVAAVDQIEAVDVAVILDGVGTVEHEERIAAVGGAARAAFDHIFAARDSDGAFVHFTRPCAVEGGDRPTAVGQIELGGHQAFELERFFAVVDELRPSRDHVALRIDAVMQL